MKEPIVTTAQHLSSILTAMLMDRGQTSYSLSPDKFEELELDKFGIQCEGELAPDGKSYTAIIATIVQAE